MAILRVAQIGQLAVNRPFYEVFYNGRRYAFYTNLDGKIEFVTPQFLKSVGISSVYADMFQRQLTQEIIIGLALIGGQTQLPVTLDSRFPIVTYGTGLGFAADFLPFKGWNNLNPTQFLNQNV